ncbi:MAG: hypothetical protein FJ098_05670 [Deltaproteobacteria bacterium]|nr:hypothetical protein [Deltaproteobacteria bacterium]
MDENKLLNEIATARGFLDDKIARERRSLKIRIVVGTLVSIVVFGYMFWLYRTLTSLGTPEGVRTIIVQTVRTQGSELLGMATREIKANKTQIIDLLTREGLDKLVDMLMGEAKLKLRGMIASISKESVDELNIHFVRVLRANADQLGTVLRDPTGEGAAEELIVKAFERDLRESVGATNVDETFKEPIGKKLSEARLQLNQINLKLKELADKQTLTHRETLMVRFIKLWGAYVADIGSGPVEEPAVPGTGRPGTY